MSTGTLDFVGYKFSQDARWPFEGDKPYFSIPDGDWTQSEYVDPFPAYGHDSALVKSEAFRVAARFPIEYNVRFCLFDREGPSRTNGFTRIGTFYKSGGGIKKREANIVLFGKHIPPHPGMTRYLVAHEYGHAVAQALKEIVGRNQDNPNLDYDDEMLYREYEKLREFVSPPHYGGGTWHANVSELFANDFRILVTKTETEFWPHPGFQRPEQLPQIVAFWESQTAEALKRSGLELAA